MCLLAKEQRFDAMRYDAPISLHGTVPVWNVSSSCRTFLAQRRLVQVRYLLVYCQYFLPALVNFNNSEKGEFENGAPDYTSGLPVFLLSAKTNQSSPGFR